MLEIGNKGTYLGYADLSAVYMRADLSTLTSKTKYPYFLLVPQPMVESILEAHARDLGIPIHWNHKLIGLQPLDEGGYMASFDSGHQMKAKHIVGADGARSSVSFFVVCIL
jgi:2-polyprenyl-6-methoxyphenol hydroxylase-like FAD-dependent oxidoreductase